MTEDEKEAIIGAITALNSYIDRVCEESGALYTEGGGLVADARRNSTLWLGGMILELRRAP